MARPKNMTIEQSAAWREAERGRELLLTHNFVFGMLIAAGCSYEWFIGERYLPLWVSIPLGLFALFVAANHLHRWRIGRRVIDEIAAGTLTDRETVAQRLDAAGRGWLNRFDTRSAGAAAVSAVTGDWTDAVDEFLDDDDDDDDDSEMRETIVAYLNAFCAGDRQALRPLLADTFKLRGPMGSFDTADDYLASLAGESTDGFAYELTQVIEDHDRDSACAFYRFTKPGGSTTIAQRFVFDDDDRIAETELVFESNGM